MLISIIIPFYDKDHNHITNMLNYLSKLSFNKEVIFIDDRNDKSLDIRKTYNIPDNYKIINSSNYGNIGTFESRRTGVLNATGDYIWFVDVDDMPLDFTNIPFDNEDIVIYNYVQKDKKEYTNYNICPVSSLSHIHYFKNFIIQPYLLRYICMISKLSLWNKLIKRTLLLDFFNKIPILKSFLLREDSYLFYELVKLSKTIKIKNNYIYCYINPNQHEIFLEELKSQNKLLNHLQECIPNKAIDRNEFIDFFVKNF